ALRDQDINLTQLGNNLFSRMLLPSHDNILHMAQSHTSGRTTFQGAGQSTKKVRVVVASPFGN
ncbi:hypothetical protein, partial [Methylobacterium sp. J-090]|uniref:hypothetical protein n=1 Tax=Methylobacterium sp. J-090 TaxID=2836666 RepID=UPI001FBAB4C6